MLIKWEKWRQKKRILLVSNADGDCLTLQIQYHYPALGTSFYCIHSSWNISQDCYDSKLRFLLLNIYSNILFIKKNTYTNFYINKIECF